MTRDWGEEIIKYWNIILYFLNRFQISNSHKIIISTVLGRKASSVRFWSRNKRNDCWYLPQDQTHESQLSSHQQKYRQKFVVSLQAFNFCSQLNCCWARDFIYRPSCLSSGYSCVLLCVIATEIFETVSTFWVKDPECWSRVKIFTRHRNKISIIIVNTAQVYLICI